MIHVPVLTGGRDAFEVHRFYRDSLIPAWPEDTTVEQVSRTVGAERAVDEIHHSFHPHGGDAFLASGHCPDRTTGGIPLVVVMGFDDGKVASEHIYWDQASLLAQVGLLTRRTYRSRVRPRHACWWIRMLR